MESTKFFSEDGVSIDGNSWSDFYKTAWDDGGEKDAQYEQKVKNAIDAWNSASQKERVAYLQTGTLPSSIGKDTISLLTSARIINFKEPKHTITPPSRPPVPPQPPIPPVPVPPQPPIDTITGDRKTDIANDPQEGYTAPKDKPTPFWKRIFGPLKRSHHTESPTPQPEDTPEDKLIVTQETPTPQPEDSPTEGLNDRPPQKPEDTPTAPSESTTTPPQPEKPEAEPEQPAAYEIIKDVKEEELPPEEQEKIKKISGIKRDTLKKALAAGALITLVALAFMKPPVEITDKNHASVETTSQEIVTTINEVPERIEEIEITPDDDPELYQKLSIQKLLENTTLGGKMSVGEGTDYWESPDHEFGGADNHGVIDNESIRPAGEYVVERLVILDAKTGEYLGNFYSGNGDSGTLAEFVEKVQSENPDREITVHVCFDDPAAGWSGNIINGNFPVVGIDGITQKKVTPGHIETITTIENHSATGETDNLNENGTIEIINDDGTSSSINIRHGDGSLYQPGETVLDSNGKLHTIRSIEVTENGKNVRIIWENVLWDAAMIAIAGAGVAAGTGIFISMRRRNGEGDTSEEQETPTDEEQSTAPEHRVEIRREMMELDANQLINLVDIFTETSGDRAAEIATQLAERAGTEIAEDNPADNPEDQGIFGAMTAPEKTVAKALLVKRDEATLRHLSELLGIELEDYAARILNESQNNNETEE